MLNMNSAKRYFSDLGRLYREIYRDQFEFVKDHPVGTTALSIGGLTLIAGGLYILNKREEYRLKCIYETHIPYPWGCGDETND